MRQRNLARTSVSYTVYSEGDWATKERFDDKEQAKNYVDELRDYGYKDVRFSTTRKSNPEGILSMKNAMTLLFLGFAGYVIYQHFGQGVAWGQTAAGPILTPLGIQGMGCAQCGVGCMGKCGPIGLGGIAPTNIYGGFAPNRGSSSLPTKGEIMFNTRYAA